MSFVYEEGGSEETKFHGTSIFTTFWISVLHHAEKHVMLYKKSNGSRKQI